MEVNKVVTTVEVHGKTFNVEKRGKEWQTNYRDAKATTGATKAEAIKALKEYDKVKLIEACEFVDKQLARDDYFKVHTKAFTSIFGFAPPRDFLMYACGCGMQLDIIALEKKLRPPDGISTNDYILKVYGEYALDIVKHMI